MLVAETSRLVLRQFVDGDVDALAAVLANPQVMRFSTSGPLDPQQVAAAIERWRRLYDSQGYGLWAVEHKTDGQLLGYCGLMLQQVEGQQDLEVGYRLDPAWWNQGLATEAAGAARDYAFERLGAKRLIAIIDGLNVASQRVAEKIGLRYERDAICWQRPVRIYAKERGGDAPAR